MKKRTVIATAAAATLLGGVGLLGAMTASGQNTRDCTGAQPGVDQATACGNLGNFEPSPFDDAGTNVVPPPPGTNPQCQVAIPGLNTGSGLTNRNGGVDVNTSALNSLCGLIG